MHVHRLIWLRIFVLVVMLVFIGRLAQLQLVRGMELRQASEQNHLRWVRSPAPRGLIRDRQGRPLAQNVLARAAWLISGEVKKTDWEPLYQRLVGIGLYPDLDAARAALADCRRFPGYMPVRLKSQLTLQMVTRLEEELPFLPGIYLKAEPVRHYPCGPLAAHLIGYLREIDRDELEARAEQQYRPGDLIGKSGIERALEEELRGREGSDQVEVNAYGRVLHSLQSVPPQPGADLTLTLDMDIQRTAEEALRGHRGAAVVLDPHTGDILAMASAPTYDLNMMSGRLSPALWAWMRSTNAQLNRATSGQYAPGSVAKVVTAAAAIESGRVPPTRGFFCDGQYKKIHCWKHSGHGTMNLTGALAQSCNVAFMKMGEEVGINGLTRMAFRFGMGEKADLGGMLPEAEGLVPDAAWARRHHHAWQPGETLQVSIGQTYVLITPLQAVRVVSCIANGGKLVHPRLLKTIGNHPARYVEPTPMGLRAGTIHRIDLGLRAVTTSQEGTARSVEADLRLAGKTGTAQNPRGLDHAWFAGYAPAENPKVAIAVIIEHGGHGGATAAPIAAKIVRTALFGPPPPAPPGASTPATPAKPDR